MLSARSAKSDARSVARGGNDARAQASRDIQHPTVVGWLSDDLDSLLHKYPRGAGSVSAQPKKVLHHSIESAAGKLRPRYLVRS